MAPPLRSDYELADFTLNSEKRQYNTNRIVVIAMLLSDKGIGLTSERVKAIIESREPETTAEVRSFLGLVSYSSRLINLDPRAFAVRR